MDQRIGVTKGRTRCSKATLHVRHNIKKIVSRNFISKLLLLSITSFLESKDTGYINPLKIPVFRCQEMNGYHKTIEGIFLTLQSLFLSKEGRDVLRL